MATKIIIPGIGASMVDGILAEWLVDDGATVMAGQPLFTIESDKTTSEVGAPASGRVVQTGTVGETYAVGAEIGEIADA